MDSLETLNCFVSSVNLVRKPQFLTAVRTVAKDSTNEPKTKNQCELYHSGELSQDTRIKDFAYYVASTGWNILKEQGYNMEGKHVFFESMWCQEYTKHAYMPQHVHPNNGSQLVGFYFLDCPDDSPNIAIHDPRAGKVQISMDEANKADITNASNTIFFKPEEGMLLFTNSWLPHSFTQNFADKSFKFIHFNIGVMDAPTACNTPEVEVI